MPTDFYFFQGRTNHFRWSRATDCCPMARCRLSFRAPPCFFCPCYFFEAFSPGTTGNLSPPLIGEKPINARISLIVSVPDFASASKPSPCVKMYEEATGFKFLEPVDIFAPLIAMWWILAYLGSISIPPSSYSLVSSYISLLLKHTCSSTGSPGIPTSSR